MAITTTRTGLRGIVGINNLNLHPFFPGLVQNETKELVKRPRMQSVFVPPTKPYSVSYSSQVLNCNTEMLCLCGLHDASTDVVVYLLGEPSLFRVSSQKKPFSRFSAFTLEFCPKLNVSGPNVIYLVPGEAFPVTHRSNLDYAQVYSQEIVRLIGRWLDNVNHAKEIPFAVPVNQVALTLSELKELTLVIATNEGDSLPTFEGPDGDFILIVAKDAIVIGNRTMLSEHSLAFLVEFVSVTNFRIEPDNHLSGKVKTFLDVVIGKFMQLELPEDFIVPGNLAHSISRFIRPLKGGKKPFSLKFTRFKLYAYGKFHKNIIANLRLYVKYRKEAEYVSSAT